MCRQFLYIFFFFSELSSFALNNIRNIELAVNDTLSYSLQSNTFNYKGEKYLAFRFFQPKFTSQIKIWVEPENVDRIKILPSPFYNVLDSCIFINKEYFLFYVQFVDIVYGLSPVLRIEQIDKNGNISIEEIKLFPYTTTKIQTYIQENELFVGEEKIFEIFSNFPENIKLPMGWVIGQDFDYRFQMVSNSLRLHLVPKQLGRKTFIIQLSSYRPDFVDRNVNYNLDPLVLNFNIKAGRLAFLNLDRKEITFDEQVRKEGIEVQIDNHRQLQINKTYRIEDQEKPGGTLIGELFTRQGLNNDKVLCRLRIYNLHRPTEGYLYIKDGDEAKFITNFGISPKTTIQTIKLLRNGVDWLESNIVYPGELLNVRLEGLGMQKANFIFEDLDNVIKDTVIQSDELVEYKVKIPLHISKKKIYIFNYGENTGSFLQVKEYQEPKRLDFVAINFGNGFKRVDDFTGPELYEKTLKDIIIRFYPDDIDKPEKLYGKQYLEINVKISKSDGSLLELITIPNIIVCPGHSSIRHAFYESKDCSSEEISLNNLLNKKTYDFDDWTRIRITFKHLKDKYTEAPQEKTVEIILQRKIKFDVDVSFPSLLTKIVKDEGWQNSLGVSMAMIAQMSFYQKDKIARFYPFKIGVGFLALNAFNFSENSTRDLGIVMLGSVYPTRRDSKLSFPLYLGGGYLLNRKSWFWVFGPGIRVSF